MKKATYFLQAAAMMTALLCSIGSIAQAQKSGVYITYADFQKDSLSYTIDCKKEKDRIRLEGFFGGKYMTIFHGKEKVKLIKDGVYGAVVCNGDFYRIQQKSNYKVEEKGKIWLYSRTKTTQKMKQVLEVYFSLDGNSPIRLLNFQNLMNAFPTRHDLHDELSVWFKNDAELSVYDGYHKAYKINRFLEKFIQ
jgi:hypothetical protein